MSSSTQDKQSTGPTLTPTLKQKLKIQVAPMEETYLLYLECLSKLQSSFPTPGPGYPPHLTKPLTGFLEQLLCSQKMVKCAQPHLQAL